MNHPRCTGLALILAASSSMVVISCGRAQQGATVGAMAPLAAGGAGCGPLWQPDSSTRFVPGLNDTVQIMRSLGTQLRDDFRCGSLLFSPVLHCLAPHPEPCGGATPDTVSAVDPMVLIAARAAQGTVCRGSSCPKDAIAEIELSRPILVMDSAFILVGVFKTALSQSGAMRFRRYQYRARRALGGTWRVDARFLHSEGSYDFPTDSARTP